MAKINLWDIKALELYDQSTFMELVSLEDLGFCEDGKAWKNIFESKKICEESFYDIDNKKLFVNTNGGLKADGNPLGATGGAQIFELFKQLTRNAGERQIKSSELNYGCSLELVGFGTKGYIHILGRA
jgi:acetyl-CoA C-acetyltransferase